MTVTAWFWQITSLFLPLSSVLMKLTILTIPWHYSRRFFSWHLKKSVKLQKPLKKVKTNLSPLKSDLPNSKLPSLVNANRFLKGWRFKVNLRAPIPTVICLPMWLAMLGVSATMIVKSWIKSCMQAPIWLVKQGLKNITSRCYWANPVINRLKPMPMAISSKNSIPNRPFPAMIFI